MQNNEFPPNFTLKAPAYIPEMGHKHFNFNQRDQQYEYYEDRQTGEERGYPITKTGIVVFFNVVDNPDTAQFLEEQDKKRSLGKNVDNFRIVVKLAESAGSAPGRDKIFGEKTAEIFDYTHIKTLRDRVYVQLYDPNTQELSGQCHEVRLRPQIGDIAIAASRAEIDIFDFSPVESIEEVTRKSAAARLGLTGKR